MRNRSNARGRRARGVFLSSPRLRPLAAALGVGFCGWLPAATIVVNDPAGTSVAGHCALVDAVASIQQGSPVGGSNCSNSGGAFGSNDTVRIPANYAITFANPAPSTMSALALTKPMTIAGAVDAAGKPLVTLQRSTVSGTPDFRLIETTADLTLQGVTLKNGNSTAYGGAVEATYALVTLANSVVTGNSALGGGSIHAQGGAVTLVDSVVSNNQATSANFTGGGGIFVYGSSGSVTAKGSTISGNSTNYSGGGISAYKVSLTNTTISGNSAASGGGGVYTQVFSATFTTITANSGGGVLLGTVPASPAHTMTATLVQGNTGANDMDSGKSLTVSGDHNLVGTSGMVVLPNDTRSCAPNLAALADNGGPTPTHAVPSGSCALDAGPTFPPGTIPSDQRGAAFARRVGAATDIGAFEAQSGDRIFYDGFGR